MASRLPPSVTAPSPGASQAGRLDPRLDPSSAPLDDKDALSRLQHLRSLAGHIAFHDDASEAPAASDDGSPSPSGDWMRFFPSEGMSTGDGSFASRNDGALPPHLALLLAWLEQAETTRALLNEFTARHLQFQMGDVLGFSKRPPVPDRAHLLVELKKHVAPVEVSPAMRFGAGRDARKVEQVFKPVRPVVVNHARVASLCRVSLDDGRLRFAPVADSLDGLGTPLDPGDSRWPPFGSRDTAPADPPAPVGFAIASPVLRLQGGKRTVRLVLDLDGLDASLDPETIADAFDAYVSTPQGWSGPHVLTGVAQGGQVELSFTLDVGDPAVVDHARDIHRQHFPDGLPVVQLLLTPDARYTRFAALRLRVAQVGVDVSKLRGLVVENDDGAVDSSKPFLAFGALPSVGSRLHLGCQEALGKPLTSLAIQLEWQAPPSLSSHYSNYAGSAHLNDGVEARLDWQGADGAPRDRSAQLLRPGDRGNTTLDLFASGSATPPPGGVRVQALRASGSAFAQRRATVLERASPILRVPAMAYFTFGAPTPSSSARAGFVTITLLGDLLHTQYRKQSVDKLLADPRVVLNEPYTPKVRDLHLSYSALSEPSRIADPSEEAFTDTSLQFFHVDAFGVAREHGWLTRARPWAPQDGIALLPRHAVPDEQRSGELMIGVSGVGAGDPLSLLVQVAEGTADPQAQTRPLEWAVLADDAWRPLRTGELVLDSTRHLRRSGLVSLVLPDAHLTGNTRMPPELVWLRAVSASPGAACDVVGVHANAVEVVFEEQGNDPDRLSLPLAAGSIGKSITPLAQVKAVRQPYASFGGAPAETGLSLAHRASERLRHRQRAITAWDWERLVLQAFPSVARVRCVPHANADSWQAPGHVVVLVVPDLRNRNMVDRLHPRVDLDTLERIREYLHDHAGMAVQVSVRNPRYVAVEVDLKLRMRPGHAFSYYRGEAEAQLVRALSPWAFDGNDGALPDFGGRVLRARLLDMVEDLSFVDYVTDFKLRRQGDTGDHAAIDADTPDAILVSAGRHAIAEVVDG